MNRGGGGTLAHLRPLRVLAASLLIFVAGSLLLFALRRVMRVQISSVSQTVPADGRFHPVAELGRRYGPALAPDDVLARGVPAGQMLLRPQTGGRIAVLYRAPVTGGTQTMRLQGEAQQWTLPLRSQVSWVDTAGDGLPEALHLHAAEDRTRFRRWFVAVAERAASLPTAALPAEITDCSALLRYSYRQALLQHDDRWYKQFAPGTVPALPSVQQWAYPETPLGAALFRVVPIGGPLHPSDYAQFADAKTLYQWNSYRVSRDVLLARPGDLLFFHSLEHNQQYHSMIVTGEGGDAWVVYHTGPQGTGASHTPGEMRRARVNDLLRHPDPRWRPVAANPNFLGVYRWNLLRED